MSPCFSMAKEFSLSGNLINRVEDVEGINVGHRLVSCARLHLSCLLLCLILSKLKKNEFKMLGIDRDDCFFDAYSFCEKIPSGRLDCEIKKRRSHLNFFLESRKKLSNLNSCNPGFLISKSVEIIEDLIDVEESLFLAIEYRLDCLREDSNESSFHDLKCS